ncbi:MAG: PGPGW domain-containing protein [Gammaproteobacteria bacterium]|nr:PGPGW domain-containing protein [Gammaproteobacteria bacterium]
MTYRIARRIAVAVVGATVLIIGIVMVFAPGPAIVFIPVGLAILGLEFAWARAWLKRIREKISENNASARGERAENHRRNHTRY